ncbi:MAG: hypothetical protein H7Y27_07785 [Gemmatimonadaceae bacterium]|nr:hypothetical protein [Chitinophagaceae bacterium]
MQDRYRQQPPKDNPPKKDDCGCDENDTNTQKYINTERALLCDELTVASGEVNQWEENYFGLKELKKRRKCLFVWTEKNYQVFRNLQITTGTSLIQFNESIKESTTGYIKSNKTLSDALKDVLKKIKEVKTKVYELRDAADDLKHCTDEGCNCTQWGIITGDWNNCKPDNNRDQPKRPPECEGAGDKFDDLFCIPKALAGDIDSVFKAAADVIGIQVFSNIGTLEALQRTLYDNAKAFDKHLQDTMKKGQEELKKSQEDFVKTVQDFSKSKALVYGKRSYFHGVFETVSFFCCPKCGCIEKDHKCEERLKKCKEKICDICDQVKDTFCDCSEEQTQAS